MFAVSAAVATLLVFDLLSGSVYFLCCHLFGHFRFLLLFSEFCFNVYYIFTSAMHVFGLKNTSNLVCNSWAQKSLFSPSFHPNETQNILLFF